MFKFRAASALGVAGIMAIATSAIVPLTTATAAPLPGAAADCSDFNDPVSLIVKPSNDASIATPSDEEAASSAQRGFTDNQGALFDASTAPKPGLVAVNRLYRGGLLQDYAYTTASAEVESAGRIFSYTDEGNAFYASVTKSDCLIAVSRYRKGLRHRLATSETKAELAADGWTNEGVFFYAAPPKGDGPGAPAPPNPDPPAPPPAAPPAEPEPVIPASGDAFSFAVIPDTQVEVIRSGDPRMKNRSDWLVKQKVKFATQTGDLVNWDTPDHSQYNIAKAGLDPLHKAGIPYTVAIGNHDTQATGVGGSARDPSRTYQLQRDTSTINQYFNAGDFDSVSGAYQSGKIDNVYSTYTAGGLKWMMLTLEFCARPAVVDWAKKVVADHPDYNVLISTHSYENGGGGIDTSNQGYGDTSGKQLFDELVSQYPNIKMVFSGHVGIAAKARVDTGVKGNKIYSFLTTMHDATSNPVRMIEVDPKAGTLKTKIYGPYTDKTWTEYSETIKGVEFVR